MRSIKIFTACAMVFFSALVTAGNPEGDNSIYLNSYLEVTAKKKDASYYCELVEHNEMGYHYRAWFMTGELKMDGWYADAGMKIPQGEFIYYYQNGNPESKGTYREGSKVGIWQRFAADGTEKPEKVYASLEIMKAIEDAKRLREMEE